MAASVKQVEFINTLLAGKIVPAPLREHAENILLHATDVSGRTVSSLIDNLMACARKPREDAPPLPALEPGTYRSADGTIFRVQVNRSSGGRYAKVWDAITARWDYEAAAYRRLAPGAAIVPLELAVQIGVATGHCVCCAADLRDPLSVLAGIGPVCVKRYGTTREDVIAARKRELQPA